MLLARAKTTKARGLEIHLIQHRVWQECALFSWPPNWLKITLLFLTSKIEDGKCWILKLNPKKIGKEGKDKSRTK